MEQKSLYTNTRVEIQTIFGILALVMFGISIYLTNHFYEFHFPKELMGKSFCNINQFFNCDFTMYTWISSFYKVPLAAFGIVNGLFFLSGFIFQDLRVEGTIRWISFINFFLCLLLFLYSLIGLHGLCPGCTVYYFSSGLCAWILWKWSDQNEFSAKVFVIFAFMSLLLFAGLFAYAKSLTSDDETISASLRKEYYTLKNYGAPDVPEHFWITHNPQAKILISKYSDFQCPSCRGLDLALRKVIEKHPGKINLEYIFYPLDNLCNTEIKQDFHAFSCRAAYLAACAKEKFPEIAHELFDNQEKISNEYIDELAKKYHLESCVAAPETKERVVKMILSGKKYPVHSTPTMIINEKKLEGFIPMRQLNLLIEELLK